MLRRFVRGRDAYLREVFGIARKHKAFYVPRHVLDVFTLVATLARQEADAAWAELRRAADVYSSRFLPKCALDDVLHAARAARLAHERGPSVLSALETALDLGGPAAVAALIDLRGAPTAWANNP